MPEYLSSSGNTLFAGRGGRSEPHTRSTRFLGSETSSDCLGSRAFVMVSASAMQDVEPQKPHAPWTGRTYKQR